MRVIGLDIGALGGDKSAFSIVEGDKIVATGELPPGRRGHILMKLWAKSIVAYWNGYETPCYHWTGPTSGNGRGGLYGRMSLNGATVATHIASWTNVHGLIPPKKQLDHKCNNRRCWREDHLELVSHKKNQKRRAARAKVSDK